MIDTGGTMIAASKLLKEKGAKEVYILATHALFNGDAVINFTNAINEGIIKNIFVTNTIEKNLNIPNLEIISVAKPISKIIEYARSRFEIKEIYGTFAAENNGSRRVMEKLGMTFFEDCEYTKFDGSRTYKAKTYRKIFY